MSGLFGYYYTILYYINIVDYYLLLEIYTALQFTQTFQISRGENPGREKCQPQRIVVVVVV